MISPALVIPAKHSYSFCSSLITHITNLNVHEINPQYIHRIRGALLCHLRCYIQVGDVGDRQRCWRIRLETSTPVSSLREIPSLHSTDISRRAGPYCDKRKISWEQKRNNSMARNFCLLNQEPCSTGKHTWWRSFNVERTEWLKAWSMMLFWNW